MIGKTLDGRYKVLKKIGKGGFGDTYLAEDLKTPNRRECIIKHLQPNASSTQEQQKIFPIAKNLFDREAAKLQELGDLCDRIPTLYSYFQTDNDFFLAMEYVEGHSLSSEIVQGIPLSEDKVRQLLREILEVLQVVHEHEIIHRDLKPDNIMRRQHDGKIVLIDFGAVKEVTVVDSNQHGVATSTIAIGTLGYTPSEQASSSPRLSSDIYALGVIAIEALTGKYSIELPKHKDTNELIWRDCAQVSPAFAAYLEKMVRYHFRDRFANATEALAALDQLERNSSSPLPRRKFLVLGTLAGGGLLGALALNSFISNNKANLDGSSSRGTTPNSTPSVTPTTPSPVSDPTPKSISNSSPLSTFTEILGNGISFEMVAIPSGTFWMGGTEEEHQLILADPSRYGGDEDGFRKRLSTELPRHQVNVPAFYMGKYEVTQEQWLAVMGDFKLVLKYKGNKLPIGGVSWEDALKFCLTLSRKTGRKYRLPSEAEWEYACRAGTTTPFYFGNTITTDQVNYNGNEPYGNGSKSKVRNQPTDVGTFPANAFGVHDMHGNVLEWCADAWHDNYNGAPTNGEAWVDGGNQLTRIMRGGAWFTNGIFCRSAIRIGKNIHFRDESLGFRVVTSL